MTDTRESSPEHFAIILNAGSGRGTAQKAEARLVELFRGAGKTIDLTLASDGGEFQEALSRAISSKAGAIVAGGGDGTISSVASALTGKDIPLGVLPLGTLNHFATDLGIPSGLDDAVQVVLDGRTTRVDVGVVNNHVFLNNSSLGLYPHIVRLREQHAARGMKKWAVAAWATAKELGRFRRLGVRLKANGETTLHRTPLVLVGNNRYRMAGLDAGTRDSLREGMLVVYVVKVGGRLQLLRLAWKIFRGQSPRPEELDIVHVEEATIEARAHRLSVALDGEVTVLDVPLEYRVRPASLRVFAPAAATADRPR